VPWEIEHTDEFESWFWDELGSEEQDEVVAAVDVLEERGPGLGRPLVDTISGSRHNNMKELRVGTIRVLFAFDPRRVGILLLGGDKRDEWAEWYEDNISIADDLYDEHLETLRKEGLI